MAIHLVLSKATVPASKPPPWISKIMGAFYAHSFDLNIRISKSYAASDPAMIISSIDTPFGRWQSIIAWPWAFFRAIVSGL